LAIEVHRTIRPGLPESVYEAGLCLELKRAGIPFRPGCLPVVYKRISIPPGFRADIPVADAVIVEIKGVAAFIPAHEAQIPTYPRMSHNRVGLLLNFHAARLKDGLQRFVVRCPGTLRGTSWSSVDLRVKFPENPHTAAVGQHDEAMIQIRTATGYPDRLRWGILIRGSTRTPPVEAIPGSGPETRMTRATNPASIWTVVLSWVNRTKKAKPPPRLYGQMWTIRRFAFARPFRISG
jgi:GxxExxY protein